MWIRASDIALLDSFAICRAGTAKALTVLFESSYQLVVWPGAQLSRIPESSWTADLHNMQNSCPRMLVLKVLFLCVLRFLQQHPLGELPETHSRGPEPFFKV